MGKLSDKPPSWQSVCCAVAILGLSKQANYSAWSLSGACVIPACVPVQMATLEKAEGLLEQLRGASHDAAVKDMEDLKKFASENVSSKALPAGLLYRHRSPGCRPRGVCPHEHPQSYSAN